MEPPCDCYFTSLPQSGAYNYYSEITPRVRQACPKVHSGYLHASKLVGYCFLKLAEDVKLQGQRQKTINFSRAGHMSIYTWDGSLLPEAHGGEVEGLVDTCRFSMFQERNIELGEATVFIVRGKQAYSLSLRDIFPLPCKHNSEK